jgi:hypothetical protein
MTPPLVGVLGTGLAGLEVKSGGADEVAPTKSGFGWSGG